jgi:cytochrome c biogenesis protein CcmG, thiol:disulfide interchange protein DsbE
MGTENIPSAAVSTDEVHAEKLMGGQKRNSRKRRILIFTLVSLMNVALLALLWSQLLTPAPNASQNQVGSLQGSSPLIGHPAPDFTLPVLNAHPTTKIHLAALKGKPVMLNFWASWCDPCKQEAPLLAATWKRVQGQGIVFLGVDFEDTQSDALSFLHTYGIPYQNVVDANGSTGIDYGITGVPETFFLNRQGIIVSKVIEELSEQTLLSNLRLITR